MKALILLNILFFVRNVHGALERVDPLVLINQGLVKGLKAADGDYSKFLGIPYAKVDLDDPFGSARAAPPFEEEIFNAYDNSRICPQTRMGDFDISALGQFDESPDCLRLNLYVPYKASSHNPLPVLVWIHGGGFVLGHGNGYEAPNILKEDIIIVTVNYRLGAYGFLCLDNPALPGNQGLKDQYAALQWVRENIAAFGGNPYNVTLAGQSAGSSAVLLQLYSSKEKLFNKVIAQSGTPLSPDMFITGDPDVAVKLASYLGLNTTDDQQALQFLAQTHHSLITAATYDLKINFKPCKEKSFSGVENFVDSEPYAFTNERIIRNTPILIGSTEQEYNGDEIKGMHGDDFFTKDFFYSRLEETYNLDKDQLKTIAEIVRHYYIGDEAVSEDVKVEAAQFLSDFLFNLPIQNTITSLIKENASPVYEYVFSYTGGSGAYVASHGTEMPYLFSGFSRGLRSETDQLVADRITSLWVNFIKHGNPTPETSELIPVKWTAISATTRPYMDIGSELVVGERFLKDRNSFWDLFHSVYGKYSNLARQCDYESSYHYH